MIFGRYQSITTASSIRNVRVAISVHPVFDSVLLGVPAREELQNRLTQQVLVQYHNRDLTGGKQSLVDVRSYQVVAVSHQTLDNGTSKEGAVVSAVTQWALKKGYGIYQLPLVTHTRRDASTISKTLSDFALYRAAGYSIVAIVSLEDEYRDTDKAWWKRFRASLIQRGWESLPIVVVSEKEMSGTEFDPGIELS